MTHIYDEIYKIVQSIPKGRVLTYGLISQTIGGRMSAQGVGWALKALGSSAKRSVPSNKASAKYNLDSVPWQRVVNVAGGTSTHKVEGIPPDLQRHLLESEGIVFDTEGKMDLEKYLWYEGLNQGLEPAKFSKRKAKEKREG